MKRSPMKRTAMRRKPRSTRYSRRDRDFDRMAWIKQQPCALRCMPAAISAGWPTGIRLDGCDGAVEAHHAGVHGLSNKAGDDTCIPLCRHHHSSLTDRRGTFSGWDRGEIKRWEIAAIEFYQRAYAERALVPLW